VSLRATGVSPALTAATARAGWAGLLPPHRAHGDDQPVGRPTCVAALDLADGLVLGVVEDGAGRTYPVPLVIAGSEVRRARAGDGAAEALIDLLAGGSREHDGFELTAWYHRPATGERSIDVDQTNESVIVAEHAVVKWTFLADEGPHPAPSLLAELERNGFTGMPRPWGALQWRSSPSPSPRLMALVTEYVPGAEDGWTWAVAELRTAAQSGEEEPARRVGACVGELVASFHHALAGTARPSTTAEAAARRSGALADLDRALAVTSGRAHEVLVRHEAEARAVLRDMPIDDTEVVRVHGDLHVGQVLRTRDGATSTYTLTDFDGNPVVPPQERIREQPAALDVAGMAQSFRHAGLVARKHEPDLDPAVVDRMAEVARSAFLDAYRQALASRRDLLDERLVRPLALRQVCREFTYAATHLPRWSYVPEAALPMLLTRGDLR
jgi:maltokinase